MLIQIGCLRPYKQCWAASEEPHVGVFLASGIFVSSLCSILQLNVTWKPLARQGKHDSTDEIKYNFEGAAFTVKLTNEKHILSFLYSFFCILFSTQNCKHFCEA